MNALLLVTSAWLAGADPTPPPAKPAPAPAAAPANFSGSCGCSTDCGCGCEEEGFWARLRGRFHRHHCEESCSPCSTCNTCNTYKPCSTCNSCSTWAVHNACECDSCGSSFGGRLRGLFSRHHNECGCDTGCNSCGCGSGGQIWTAPAGATPSKMPPAGEQIPAPKAKTEGPAKELPKGTTAAPALDLTPTAATKIEESKNPFELDRRYETRVDRAADYSWLTGQLFYVHTDGGRWVLRYAPIWKEEANGGSVVLARDVPMDSYREGDLVQVRGEILQPKASPSLGGPLYHLQSIQLMDRLAQ